MPRPSSAAAAIAAGELLPDAIVLAGLELDELPDLEPGHGILADPDAPGYVPWTVDGPGSAEWAMTRLAEAVAALEPIEAKYEARRAALDQLEAEETAGLRQTVRFMAAQLEAYAVRLREAGELGREARVRLANGYVQTTAASPRFEVADVEAVVAFVRKHWGAAVAEKVVEVQVIEKVPHAGLKLLVELVGWPTAVRLSPCEHLVEVGDGLAEPDSGELLHPLTLEPGRGVICPECSAEALVAKVTESRVAAVDAGGLEVDGLRVIPAKITAAVHPRRPV